MKQNSKYLHIINTKWQGDGHAITDGTNWPGDGHAITDEYLKRTHHTKINKIYTVCHLLSSSHGQS